MKSNYSLDNILSLIPVPTYILNKSGVILDVIGNIKKDLIGQSLFDTHIEKKAHVIVEKINNAIHNNKKIKFNCVEVSIRKIQGYFNVGKSTWTFFVVNDLQMSIQ